MQFLPLFTVLLFPIPAEVPKPVSVTELSTNAERYAGTMVRIEVVLDGFRPTEQWEHGVKPKAAPRIDVEGRGKPIVKNGDKVAITGRFQHAPGAYSDRRIVGAKMERIPFDLTPTQLRTEKATYHERLVRVEGVVARTRSWAGTLTLQGLDVAWPGDQVIRRGDRVRVTGTFHDGTPDGLELPQIYARNVELLPGELDGLWGEHVSEPEVALPTAGVTMVIEKNVLTLKGSNTVIVTGAVVIDPERKTLDLRVTEGPWKGQMIRGIYTLKDGLLRWTAAFPGDMKAERVFKKDRPKKE